MGLFFHLWVITKLKDCDCEQEEEPILGKMIYGDLKGFVAYGFKDENLNMVFQENGLLDKKSRLIIFGGTSKRY